MYPNTQMDVQCLMKWIKMQVLVFLVLRCFYYFWVCSLVDFFGFNPLMVQQKSFTGVKGSLMEEKLITCLAI